MQRPIKAFLRPYSCIGILMAKAPNRAHNGVIEAKPISGLEFFGSSQVLTEFTNPRNVRVCHREITALF